MTNKIVLFLFLLLAFVTACQNNSTESVQEIRGSGGPNSDMVRNPASADLPLDTNKLARISYQELEYEFGEVSEGKVVEHKFKFTNTGNVPLTILNARSSCGCTIPEWPEEPVKPGNSGEILVKFNTEMKVGKQKKTIYITANTYPNETKVALVGLVNPK